jgi:hypothetical protein
MSQDASGPTPPPIASSVAARRMRYHRERRREGLLCVTIELRETEVTELIKRGPMGRRRVPSCVGRAVEAISSRKFAFSRRAWVRSERLRRRTACPVGVVVVCR